MFAYCRNNPVCRVDITGLADATHIEGDGELLSSDELEPRRGAVGHQNQTSNSGQSSGKGFPTFSSLKKFLGSAGENNHWHHIVEQCQIGKSGFSLEQINNTSNVIAVDAQIHAQITGYYNTRSFDFTHGLSVRDWLAGQPFQVQYDFGISVLEQFGVK